MNNKSDEKMKETCIWYDKKFVEKKRCKRFGLGEGAVGATEEGGTGKRAAYGGNECKGPDKCEAYEPRE